MKKLFEKKNNLKKVENRQTLQLQTLILVSVEIHKQLFKIGNQLPNDNKGEKLLIKVNCCHKKFHKIQTVVSTTPTRFFLPSNLSKISD